MSWYPGILWPFIDLCLEVFLVIQINFITPLSLNFQQTRKANGFFSFSLCLLSLIHFLGPDPYSFLHCDTNFNVF